MAMLLMTWIQTRTPQQMLGRIMVLLMFSSTCLAGDLRDIEQMEPDHIIFDTENIRLTADDMKGIPPGLKSLQSEPDNCVGSRVRLVPENPPHPGVQSSERPPLPCGHSV